MPNLFEDCPQIVRDFLFYMQTIKGRSERTVQGYYIDLRTFFRFILLHYKRVPSDTPLNEISIKPVDLDLIKTITLSDAYEFLHYVTSERDNNANTRSRKSSSIRSFFNYLSVKVHLIEKNPMKELEVPSVKKSLPKYLTLEQCLELLKSIDGEYRERDYCIITLFINCGMRLSELVGLNLSDISDNKLRLFGKGNKERVIYINQACLDALGDYLQFRSQIHIDASSKNALFVSRNGKRISRRRVQEIVENNLRLAGLGDAGLSTHKLRHTAATMMYQNGGVDIRILQEILGHSNLGTTEIYTHLSSSQMEQAASSTPLANYKKPRKPKKTE